MQKFARAVSYCLVLVFMLLAGLSGAACCTLGCGFVIAQKDNRLPVSNYTQTNVFRRTTRETFDALYEAVSARSEPVGIPDGTAYFAFSLKTNATLSSDPQIADIPSFEAAYGGSDAYIYFCRYSANVFRGSSSVTGQPAAFEYPYTDAATAIFDGTMRNYEDAAILIAVLRPTHLSTDGFGAALLEWFVLRRGLTSLFVLAGVFLFSLAVVLVNGSRRRRIERRISDLVSWLYLELRLAAIAAVIYVCIRAWAFPPTYQTTAAVTLLLIPMLYVLRCSLRYRGGRSFFSNSAAVHIIRFLRDQLNAVLPVSQAQRGVRMQAIRLILFGFCLPMLLFFLSDLLLGLRAVRLMIPFYLFYFAVLFALFYRQYARLVNQVSELERLSAMLPLGEHVPQSDLTDSDPLYPLTCNLNAIDDAVNARAEQLFIRSHKKLAQLSASISELKEQLRLLETTACANASCESPDASICLKRLNQITDTMLDTVMQNMPVTAPVLKRLDLLTVLDEVSNARMPEISAAQLTIHSHLPSAPVLITADPRQIHAVLDILYGNLAMYALAGSNVELHIRREGEFWRFVLVNLVAPTADTGDAATKFSTGLTLAREYLALNGGSLESSARDNRFGVSILLPAAH